MSNAKHTHYLRFSAAARANIEETGLDWVRDISDVRAGDRTLVELLNCCLEGADDDRVAGWCDYVTTVSALAESGRDVYQRSAYLLSDLLSQVSGGLVRNDRGNGAAGPVWLGEDIDQGAAELEVELVTEDEDPDAWRLAREATATLTLGSQPEMVAVSKRAAGDNGYQAIFAG